MTPKHGPNYLQTFTHGVRNNPSESRTLVVQHEYTHVHLLFCYTDQLDSSDALTSHLWQVLVVELKAWEVTGGPESLESVV